MWLSTRENRGLNEEEDMWNEIWQHQQIYTIFLRHILTKVQKKSMIAFCIKGFSLFYLDVHIMHPSTFVSLF